MARQCVIMILATSTGTLAIIQLYKSSGISTGECTTNRWRGEHKNDVSGLELPAHLDSSSKQHEITLPRDGPQRLAAQFEQGRSIGAASRKCCDGLFRLHIQAEKPQAGLPKLHREKLVEPAEAFHS